jgi:hypothetical protein
MSNININPKWGMKDVYQFLMGHINPVLLLENLDHLDDGHSQETDAEKKERYEGYARDLQQFQKDFRIFLATFGDMNRKTLKTMRKAAEQFTATLEHEAMNGLLT